MTTTTERVHEEEITKQSQELKSNHQQMLIVTAPWILYFGLINLVVSEETCDDKLIKRLKHALYYHLISTVLVFLIFYVKNHALNNRIPLKENAILWGGLRFMEIAQSISGWITLIGLFNGQDKPCAEWITYAVKFYLLAHVFIIAKPLAKYVYQRYRVRTLQVKEKAN